MIDHIINFLIFVSFIKLKDLALCYDVSVCLSVIVSDKMYCG